MDPGWSEFSIFDLAFVEGVLPRYGGMFEYKEGAPGNSGAMGGEPSQGASFSWLSVPNTICLVCSFRTYNNPILKTEFLHIS